MSLIDVRSPKEFLAGHIPGASNLALFSDEERHAIGLTYKKKGPQEAIALGITFAAPKAQWLLQEGEKLLAPITIYCWRGGMRSQAVQTFFSAAKIEAKRLAGGYKSWRGSARELFSYPWKLKVLGGLTGSGKTERLETLREQGNLVINLEKLANHKGSVFGYLGRQPTTEHFQNLLASELAAMDKSKEIYLEDESRMIGSCQLPAPFFARMRQAELLWIETDLEERLLRLQNEYQNLPKEKLIEAVEKLRKRLGGKKTKDAIQAICQGDLREAAALILDYYDKTYLHAAKSRVRAHGPL